VTAHFDLAKGFAGVVVLANNLLERHYDRLVTSLILRVKTRNPFLWTCEAEIQDFRGRL